MKNVKSVIWGIILIVVGVILGSNSLGLTNINIFIDGWWTLFIIIPSLINIFVDEDKTGSIIGVLIGIILFLACQDVISFEIVGKLFFPMIIIIIGLSMIFKSTLNKEINNEIKKLNENKKEDDGYTATFSGQDINFDKEVFNGTEVNAFFGGVKLDLRNAIIKKDVVINATSIFGGIDIYVPKDVIIKTKSNSIFGGVTNKKRSDQDKKHTIYVNATCMFGGVEIK